MMVTLVERSVIKMINNHINHMYAVCIKEQNGRFQEENFKLYK